MGSKSQLQEILSTFTTQCIKESLEQDLCKPDCDEHCSENILGQAIEKSRADFEKLLDETEKTKQEYIAIQDDLLRYRINFDRDEVINSFDSKGTIKQPSSSTYDFKRKHKLIIEDQQDNLGAVEETKQTIRNKAIKKSTNQAMSKIYNVKADNCLYSPVNNHCIKKIGNQNKQQVNSNVQHLNLNYHQINGNSSHYISPVKKIPINNGVKNVNNQLFIGPRKQVAQKSSNQANRKFRPIKTNTEESLGQRVGTQNVQLYQRTSDQDDCSVISMSEKSSDDSDSPVKIVATLINDDGSSLSPHGKQLFPNGTNSSKKPQIARKTLLFSSPSTKKPRLTSITMEEGPEVYNSGPMSKSMQNGRQPRILISSKPFVPHNCNSSCVPKISLDSSTKFRHEIPYSIPVILGWKRQVGSIDKKDSKGTHIYSETKIFYVAPCGRQIRNIDELDLYLYKTRCPLNIDLFTFEPHLELYPSHFAQIPKCLWYTPDFTKSQETKAISAINTCDRTAFPVFNYIKNRYECPGVKIPKDPDFMIHCDCLDDCRNKDTCACQQLTIEGTELLPGYQRDTNAGYHQQRLQNFLLTGIFECNPKCACSEFCRNKVVQKGIKVLLQVFKTVTRGWGVRCLHDIPAGTFICTYAGEVMKEDTAISSAVIFGDEYLANLDFIDVYETTKADYESSPEFDLSDDDDDVQSNLASENLDGTSKKSKSRSASISFAVNSSSQESTAKGRNQDNRTKRSQAIQSNNRGECEVKPLRHLYGENFSYTIDAKRLGNVGRFLNHSCAPNCYVQSVFVDSQDLRFPWVAFFTSQFIPAFSELTWDYNYEIGSVEGKEIKCCCNTPECRFRLL